MEVYMEDCKALLSQLKQQDKELRLKRRWLMDLHLSEREQKKMEKLKPPGDLSLPESLLREDDLNYENIRTSVAKAFGVHKGDRMCHGTPATSLSSSAENLKGIYSMLEKMNNKGLCCIAEIVTGGSITFEKTKWQMRRIIKQFLPKILHKHDDSSQGRIQISQLLKDPQNFCVNRGASCSTSESFRSSAIYVLDRLEKLSILTLKKMHRDLRGVRGYIPKMQPKRTGQTIKSLAKQIRRTSLKMLSNYEEGDEPPKPLAKALSVAALMLKLELDYCPSQRLLHKLPPDIEALQNDIAKAIRILNDKKKFSFAELGNLPLVLLDSNAKAVEGSVRLRVILKNLLTEYFLECSDLQSIPEILPESLAIINKKSTHASTKTYSNKEVEEEAECVLSISAQIKQIVWDLLTECDVSEDFANAYIENAEESYYEGCDEDDHLYDLPQNCRSSPNASYSQAESVGEIKQSDSKSPITASQDNGLSSLLSPKLSSSVKLEPMYTDEADSVRSNWFDNSLSFLESKASEGAKSISGKDHHACTSMSVRDQDRFATHFSPNKGSGRNDMEEKGTAGYLGCRPPKFTSAECSEDKNVSLHRQNFSRNEYLLIQEGSDETSMVAYSLVGCMLNKFAQLDGLQLNEDDVSYLLGNTSDPKFFEDFLDPVFRSLQGGLC